MLKGGKAGKQAEKDILIKGMDRKHTFYVVGIPKEFSAKFGKKVTIIVDNKFFTGKLKELFGETADVMHEKITVELIKKLLDKQSLICHIDDNLLGDYSHSSHFIVLEKIHRGRIVIIDPIFGKRTAISEEKLAKAIESLKKHVKMCPLIMFIK